jgi:phosphoglycerate dehydrogenase-like enzyme
LPSLPAAITLPAADKTLLPMEKCLIVCASAPEFASEIRRLADGEIAVKVCVTADEALAAYAGERILLGDPGVIATILPRLPGVRWVQSTWAGVKPLIDITQRGYLLTGVKGVFGPQMSEYVLGYLLAHELRILDRFEAQANRLWDSTHSGTLAGKCLGILGTGSIGGHIARSSKSVGLDVVGLSRSGRPTPGFDEVFAIDDRLDFLSRCDYLVSTLPQTPETDALLDAEAFGRLPPGSYFVNVGRSNVVDDDALIGALESGRLAGATLDVFDEEPLPADSPLWQAPNLRITAHIAAVSHPALIAPVFVRNYRHFVAGEPLEYLVDFEAGY